MANRVGKCPKGFGTAASSWVSMPASTLSGCSSAKECPVPTAGRHCGTFRKPCAKTFGERCALQGLPDGVVSPNAAKSASLVNDVPCRHLYEGYFHQTILNNCYKSTKRHVGQFPTLHVRS